MDKNNQTTRVVFKGLIMKNLLKILICSGMLFSQVAVFAANKDSALQQIEDAKKAHSDSLPGLTALNHLGRIVAGLQSVPLSQQESVITQLTKVNATTSKLTRTRMPLGFRCPGRWMFFGILAGWSLTSPVPDYFLDYSMAIETFATNSSVTSLGMLGGLSASRMHASWCKTRTNTELDQQIEALRAFKGSLRPSENTEGVDANGGNFTPFVKSSLTLVEKNPEVMAKTWERTQSALNPEK